MIKAEKWQSLRNRMAELGIAEADLIEKFIIGSGRGGQKLQKTASCVYLQHPASGIEVKCQQERSREHNRYYARQRLCDKLEESLLGEQSAQKQAQEKIRRQKRRRSRRAQKKVLEEKSQRSTLKSLRQKPSADE